MLPCKFLTFTTLVACWHHAAALNILAIASQPLKSHYMVFGPLFRELANRGHMVTVINNYPDVVPMTNLTFINLSSHMPFKNGTSEMEYYEHINSNILRIINVYRHVALGPHSAKVDCENFFKHKDVIDHLEKGIKYDVIFVEQFMSDCGLAYAATMYDAPIIGITSTVMLPWTYPRMGIPFNFASDAFYFSSDGPNPSLYLKVEAKLMDWYLSVYGKWIIHRSIDNVFKEFYPSVKLDLDKITKERVRMVFSYQHFSLTGTRLLSPQILEIGGLHIREPQPLSEGIKYDVIFVEQFMSDCGLAYAATMYDAPIIGITSTVMLPWTYPRMGIPFNFASDAFYFSSDGPNPSLYLKVEAKLMDWYLSVYGKWIIHRSIDNVFKEFYPSVKLDLDKITKERVRMVFSYQHFSLTGTRLLSPQILEIGGLHIREPQPLSEKLEHFLATADNGAIYVSFGSNLKSSSMSKERLQHFLDAFKQIPQKVIWKWEDGPLPGYNVNVFTQAWLPQVDVLCHPKVIAFISHGGMLSLSETTYCGKPLVTIPFFGDQFSNGAAANKLGFGKMIFFDDINTEILVSTIKELTSKKMQEAAKRVQALWHDRPQSPMDSAIYWTEYVARHRDSPLHLPSMDNTWFDDLQVDVTVAIIALFLGLLILLYVVVRIVIAIVIYLIFKRGRSKKEKKA